MTTVYKFKAYYTDSGVGAVQDPAPTCRVINAADDSILADAQTPTASINMPGLYYYEYSGADGLDVVTRFATTDTGCDVKQLASYVCEKITTNLNADVAGVEAKVDTIDDLVDDLETRLTAARSGYLDKLNVSGTLAHSDAAATYKADVSALALEDTLTAMKGAGWTNETLVALDTAITAVMAWAAAAISASYTSGTISDIRGSSWSIAMTDLTLDANKQQFMLKRKVQDPDADAILFVDSATGLITLNGVSTGLTAGDASLVYAGTTLTLTVKTGATAQLPVGTFHYGIQSVTAAGVVEENYGGTFTITADIVRATA